MVATALGLGESSGSHASSVQHVEMVGSASVIDEQSPGAEHAAWEHGELGTSGQAVSSQHATADEQTSALADDEAAPHVGSVHALEMWWMSEQGEDDADEVQSRQSVAQDTGTAIQGAARADFYWGSGEAAGQLAGRMKQRGEMWILWPRQAGEPSAR